jgi:prepilin-type processing-associated H-X9-DG protein
MLAIGEALYGAPGVIVDGQGFGRASSSAVSAFSPSGYDYAASTRRANERHQGRANVVFTDGHVEALPLKTLFEDTSDAALSLWNRDHQPHRERLQ